MMLAIENLGVDYFRRGQTIHAVRDFSLTINAGETVGLVGESGSGKSTVALAILRLFRPQEGRITSGRILFQGQDLLALSEDRMREIRGKRISMIFQDPFTSLNPVMSIRSQLEEMSTQGLKEALERVQLDPERVLNAYPHQLSGGQRQRVMIAMALLGGPQLVLADEPTTALDVLVQKEVLHLLFQLQQEIGFGLLFITHNIPLVANRARRLAVMQNGRIVEEGLIKGFLEAPRTGYARELMDACRKMAIP